MEEIKTDIKDDGLRDIAKGFIRFSIKAEDTEYNVAVHDAFKEFCEVECDNNYTQGLKRLLTFYEEDARFEALWDKLKELESRIVELEQKKEKKDEVKDDGTF